ncbi:MAG: trypsin-like peptidase domain-containing protein [Candidatus Omnitrophica bacterium]|nr:trypsin-like peptidase domain-containing protein [Candidatus Omnitrophota bacterium]
MNSFWAMSLIIALVGSGQAMAKDKGEGKIPIAGVAKGEFSINPGQSIDESLSSGDDQFDDDTYYDQYNLSWPGGDLSITMDSADFDEYLIVFEPPGYPDGNRVDVDSQTGTPAEVYQRSNAPQGSYTIWANSYEPSTGNYRISVSQSDAPTLTPTPTSTPTECPTPSAPSNPSPADGSVAIPTDVNLSWSAKSIPKVIYGTDDRMEVYELQNPDLLAAADATMLIVGLSYLNDNQDGTYTIDNESFTDYIERRDGSPLCPDEPYRLQPVPGNCTGFLVGDDLVVTAGHCMEGSGDCGSNAFVFGFDMIDANTPRLTIDSSEIYYCTEIIDRAQSGTGPDWALVRLDRPVTGHKPLEIRRTGKIADGQGLVIMGHPVGLPKKIAGNAAVRSNSAGSYFVANLDSYSGNSGSPVFNAQDLVVEGVLVRGNNDFQLNGNCYESVRCSDTGCRGEDCTRTTEFASLVPELPNLTYTVFFGECGSLSELGSTTQPTWDLPMLNLGTNYCWQIQVTNGCGNSLLGPVWSFTTEGETPTETPTATPTATEPGGTVTPTVNVAADINGDKVIDSLDLIEVLDNWMRVVPQ